MAVMLRDPVITKWLGGIEPAWTMLDEGSLAALRHPPSPVFGPIRLAADLTPDEIRQSPLARTALVLLHAAAEGPGLKMTATGNLSRAVVAEMCDLCTWPGFDASESYNISKAVNEPEIMPLFLVRHAVQGARLVHRYKFHLKATPAGRKMLHEPNNRALQAVLFHIVFWFLDLGYLSWSQYAGWPQRDAGTIFWSLSVAAHDWQTPENLTRLCTIPTSDLFNKSWDATSGAMESQILRLLTWFGLLECQELEPGRILTRRSYRKTSLFDRFLSFDIQLAGQNQPRH